MNLAFHLSSLDTEMSRRSVKRPIMALEEERLTQDEVERIRL